MITNLIFALTIGGFSGLVSCVAYYSLFIEDTSVGRTCGTDDDEDEQMSIKVVAGVCGGFIAFFLFLFMMGDYANRTQDIAEITTSYKYNLGNTLILVNSLNEKVVVETSNKQLIIDMANVSQSSTTSEVYKNYVRDVNEYNKKLATLKIKCERSFVPILWYGFHPKITNEVKFIKIKM